MEVKKSPKADLEGTKGMGVLMGLVISFAILFVGFEWGSRDVQVVTEADQIQDVIAEEEIEITRPENTPAPPPPPPAAPAVAEELNIVDDDVELEQQDIITSEDTQGAAQTETYVAPTEVVEEEEEEAAQQIFTVVEEKGRSERVSFEFAAVFFHILAYHEIQPVRHLIVSGNPETRKGKVGRAINAQVAFPYSQFSAADYAASRQCDVCQGRQIIFQIVHFFFQRYRGILLRIYWKRKNGDRKRKI